LRLSSPGVIFSFTKSDTLCHKKALAKLAEIL